MSDSYFPVDSLNAMNVDVVATDAVSGEDTNIKLGDMLHGYVVVDEDNQLKSFADDSMKLTMSANISENSLLPDYSEANDGDALIIDNGEPTWGAVDALPEIEESDEGKVLAVDQGEAVWAEAPSGLPTFTAEDVGRILTVVEDGGVVSLAWVTPESNDPVTPDTPETTE